MGSGGEQHQVALRIGRQTPQQLIALLAPSTLAGSAGVGLIHDHELAAAAQEALAVAVALDPIEAHHRERNHVKDRLARRQSPLQLLGGAGPNHLGSQVELADHVALPLLTQVRWADDRDLADLAAIEQFAGDQQCLHRFAQAHLIGDQHPTHLLLERHQQRHQLVRPRLQRHIAEAAEGPRTGTQLEQQGIAQQQRRALGAAQGRIRQGKAGGLHLLTLQRPEQGSDRLITAAQGPQPQHLVLLLGSALGQRHPLPSPHLHDRAGAWDVGQRWGLAEGGGHAATSSSLASLSSSSI